MSGSQSVAQFIDDDEGYLSWVRNNPGGLVVNSERTPRASYLVLHRASCVTVTSPERGNWTTTGYIKTCSTDLGALSNWARLQTGGELKPCGMCKPVWQAAAARIEVPVRQAYPQAGAAERSTRPEPFEPPAHDRTVPATISTGCTELDKAWHAYALTILERSQILIPDTDDDLTWHAFLGHSIDMQGFRAAEFAGVDALTRHAPAFVPLNRRGIGVAELGSLWNLPAIRQHLLGRIDHLPLAATLQVLRLHGGSIGSALAESFQEFPWRKFHWSVRALLQNSAVLERFDFSFRRWLKAECDRLGATNFPPADFRRQVTPNGTGTALEQALRESLKKAFYMVGPAMSAYMLCDWQLWLWREGRTAVFANFKLDSYHEAFIKKFGADTIPISEQGFAKWWLDRFPALPPRLANECIWLAVEHRLVNPW